MLLVDEIRKWLRRSEGAFVAACMVPMSWGNGAGAITLGPDEIFEHLSPSVWTVWTFDERSRPMGTGSAVVIGPGRLITNCHVVEKGASLSVRRENVRYGATVELWDPERDLCQLKVANFDAPSVVVADASTLKIGARVFTIGSPKGLEMTLSDGLISALRRDDDGSLRYIQTSAPISPGSSGGGLFDQQGRLIGITTMGGRDAQNLNFAVPAQLIAELAQRSRAHEAKRQASSGASGRADASREFVAAERRAGDWFEYRVTDVITRMGRTFTLSVERVARGRVIFSGGSRIEGPMGELIELDGGALSELDALNPPGGWAEIAKAGAGPQTLQFSSKLQSGHPVRFDVTTAAAGEERIKVGNREYSAQRIDIKGWADRPSHISGTAQAVATPYRATVWFSPEMRRVLRFSFAIRNTGETLELVDVGNR